MAPAVGVKNENRQKESGEAKYSLGYEDEWDVSTKRQLTNARRRRLLFLEFNGPHVVLIRFLL